MLQSHILNQSFQMPIGSMDFNVTEQREKFTHNAHCN